MVKGWLSEGVAKDPGRLVSSHVRARPFQSWTRPMLRREGLEGWSWATICTRSRLLRVSQAGLVGSCAQDWTWQPSNHSAPRDSKKPTRQGKRPLPTKGNSGPGTLSSLKPHQAPGTPALPWDLSYDPGILSWSPGACWSTQTWVHRGCKSIVHPEALDRQPAQLRAQACRIQVTRNNSRLGNSIRPGFKSRLHLVLAV